MAGVDQRLHSTEQRGGVLGSQCVNGVVDQCDVGGAQQRQRPLVVNAVALRAGQQLVQDTQGVARRTTAGPDDQGEHHIVDLDVFGLQDAFDEPAHGARRQQSERVVVGARADGGQHLLRFGGGEHEDQVLRWLLDDFQQRIETGRGDHVRLVDDEDPIARLRGGVERPIP